MLCAQNDTPSYGALLAQECPTHYPINDDPEPTTVFPEPTTSALKECVQFVDADPPTVLPQPAPAPFACARQQETAPQVVEEVDEHVLEALITISQRELFAIAPDVRAHIADDTRKRQQQQVQAMMHDITDDVPDAAIDTLSYEDRLLRFQDAREAPRALWHWQEVDTATCSAENTGRDALADTPFANSFSLRIPRRQLPTRQRSAGSAHACTNRHRSSPARHLLHQRRHPQLVANASTRI